MKKIYLAFTMLLTMAACTENKPSQQTETNKTEAGDNKLADCDITLNGIHFTKSINGGDKLVTDSAGIITVRANPNADFFIDPNEKISQDDAGILLTEVDNTKPFTFKGKVTSGFLKEGGLYNAATFFVFANDTLWQKLCFEQGDHGEHRIVSVRTIGTSDDNNHDVVDSAKSVYFKISSDTHTIASYFSLDGQEWQMVRIYRNNYPQQLYLGICSQAPQAEECVSTFEELELTTDNVDDFRMGN